jgi:hypothetical protein
MSHPRTLLALALLAPLPALAAERPFYGDPPDATHPWAVHDRNRPLPPVVTPGRQASDPPSDATVLFDGTSLDAWESVDKQGKHPARWKIVDGALQVVPKAGILRTKASFGACQLHIEWAAPTALSGTGQGRGNSGVFLMGKYEIQVLDSFANTTYADGQAASVYAERPPLANAMRPPGEWQAYDILFHPATFGPDGKVIDRATVTVIHNGVVVQDHAVFEGLAGHMRRPKYSPHPPEAPLELQDHGNPVRFRNIWIRPLPSRALPSPERVLAIRAETAAQLRAAAAEESRKPDTTPWEEAKLWLESLVYADDPAARERATALAARAVAEVEPWSAEQVKSNEFRLREMRSAFVYLLRHRRLPEPFPPLADLEKSMRAKGLEVK